MPLNLTIMAILTYTLTYNKTTKFGFQLPNQG